MHVDPVDDLAARFTAGDLSGTDYLALVEQERAATLPAARTGPASA
jgi:hypothetical protein